MEVDRGELKGVKVCRSAPEVSHLLFADDSIIFCRADDKDVAAFKRVLELYENESGQKINFSKSEVTMSANVPAERKETLKASFGVILVEMQGKYLGCQRGLEDQKLKILRQ